MSISCTEDFQRLADSLGGISCDANAVVTVRAPWELNNWTLSIVELLVVGGAVLGLIHAIAMLRRHRQPAWLGLWIATVVYVIVLEPPLYFPESFGLGDKVGLTFVHNTFSIEFLYDRLPLYIVALYPCGIYLAHALVDRLGVFRRHGILVGAITVGVVNHAFYEIFDHLGPQVRWWAWNTEVSSARIGLSSVPYSSMVLFAAISPAILVALARRFLFTGATERRARSWTWRTLATGVLTPLLTPIITLPIALVLAPEAPNETLVISVMWATLLTMVAIAGYAVVTSRPISAAGPGVASWYPAAYAAVYLVTFIVLWATALPDLIDATKGVTADGTPVGSPFYALACLAVCAWLTFRSTRGTDQGLDEDTPIASRSDEAVRLTANQTLIEETS